MTEDAKTFGETAIVYCKQHLAPHHTGWCTVGIKNKIPLEAQTLEEAYEECKQKGYKLYKQ